MKYNPWDYQKAAESWILSHPKCGLFLSMGLGKTVITLSAIQKLLAESQAKRILVIAPLRVAATVWAEEINKWDHLHGLRAVKVLGSQQERLRALKADSDIYIINRENVPWLIDQYTKTMKWPFDMLVIDELSSFKSPKAERFRALRRTLPAVRRVVGLTGTPAPNGLIDLWSQVYLLDQGQRLCKTLGQYQQLWFDPGDRNGAIIYNWRPKKGAAEEIYSRLSDLCISMTAEDYLKLPDRIDLFQPVELSDTVQKAYETMEKELVLPIAQDEIITAQNAAVLAGKLLQLANGALYTEEGGWVRLHDQKLAALEDLVEAANGQPVLVYVAFRSDVERIVERFPQARVLHTDSEVRDWNAGKIQLLVAHPAAAGHGLNLQNGGHIIVWFGLTWSLELYQQANARLHRQGQQHPVTVYHIVTKGTIDENVLQVLTGKAERQDALIDAVKARVDIYAG